MEVAKGTGSPSAKETHEFTRSTSMEGGEQWVWCAHDSLVWTKAQILSMVHDETDTNLIDERKIEYLLSLPDMPGIIKRVKADQVYRVDPTHELDLDNLCLLNDMHEAPLLDLLRRRFFTSRIYTFTGDVLISINPYEKIDGLYDNPSRYLDKTGYLTSNKASIMDGLGGDDSFLNESPHVFRIANQALKSLISPRPSEGEEQSQYERQYQNQSIIISGESGAGKTENSKYVLNFLIYANNFLTGQFAKDSHPVATSGADFENHLKAVLLHSSVVLEAFGNAKTVRNDNSSRFGKYIKLLYLRESGRQDDGTFPHLVSANTETFLLEKSRLTSIGQGERTYHVFYQAMAGIVDPATRAQLGLDQPETNFELLTQGGCRSHSVVDKNEFQATLEALQTLQFSSDEITSIWKIVACIMHLNNLQIDGPEDPSVAVKISCPTLSLEQLADFLGLEAVLFTIGLTTQELQVARRASIKIKILNEGEVRNNVLALMKWLYSKLFDWIVRKINLCHNALCADKEVHTAHFIGILDIFGFEILRFNSFEQLCINFTNERLQQQFNEHVFVSEQAMYAQQGLEWSNITFRDNQPVIDLISSPKKPTGLLLILEEHGLLNRKPDDLALLNGFNQIHDIPAIGKAAKAAAANALYAPSRFGNDSFVLRHFAGEVTYSVKGFLAKNNDALQEDLVKLLRSTSSDFLVDMGQIERPTTTKRPSILAGLFGGAKEATSAAPAGGAAAGKKMASSASVSQQFRVQLDQLMATLRSTTPHYIKCIKPNNDKVAQVFTSPLVIQQLRYSGVLEVVRIRREGFPLRLSFQEFYRNYEILMKGRPQALDCSRCSAEELKAAVRFMLQCSLQPEQYQLGHSMVFLRHDGLHEMREAIRRFYGKKATVIQAKYRGRYWRRKFLITQKRVSRMQGFARMFTKRSQFMVIKNATIKIKRFLISRRLRRLFLAQYQEILAQRRLRAVLTIQRVVRGHEARKIFLQCVLQRKRKEKAAAIKLQSVVRMYRGRVVFLALLTERNRLRGITRVQAWIRRFLAKLQLVRLRNQAMRIAASVYIQAYVRRHQHRRRFQAFCGAVVAMQAECRRRRARKAYRHSMRRILALQRLVRTFLLARRYAKARRSVVAIQASIRQVLARKKAFRKYAAVLCLQSFFRMAIARQNFHLNIGRCIYIQALIRRVLHRKHYQRTQWAILRLQTHIRGFVLRRRYILQACATLAVQTMVRMHQARRRYRRLLRCVVAVQSFIRRVQYQRQYRSSMASVVKMQKLVRGYLQRVRYVHIYVAIVTLQAFGRMINASRAFSTAIISAIMIQARYRLFACRKTFLFQRLCAVRIQKMVRGMRAREECGVQIHAVLKLQAFGRMLNARRRFDECLVSAITLQAVIRKFLAVARYHRARRACLSLQGFGRGVLARQAYRQQYAAVVRIQSFGRMVIHKQSYDECLVSILVMQAVIRRGLCRRRYVRLVHACVAVQSVLRRMFAQHFLRRHRMAATRISQAVRCHQQYSLYRRMRAGAGRIQVAVRAFLRNLHLFRRLKKLHYACTTELSEQPVQERERLSREILSHFHTHPEDRRIRFRMGHLRSVLHSLLLGRNEAMIRSLGFSCQEAMDVDRLGRSSAHYAAVCGSFKCLRAVADAVNSFKFKTLENMQGLDEDDEDADNDAAQANAQLKQVLVHSVGKSSLRQGWLKKKRGGLMWQRRWVVLTEDYIIYYKNNTTLHNPKFAIPLQGCTVVRVPGREPIVEVNAPNMGEKRSFFGTSTKKAMSFMAENEKELQEWFIPLKAVAGVGNLRDKPVHYVNTLLRSLWLNERDVCGDNVLHVLSRGNKFASTAWDEDEDLRFFDKNNVLVKPSLSPSDLTDCVQMMAWCMEFGCAVNVHNDAGDTPLHVAVKTNQPSELIYALLVKGADGMDALDQRDLSVWDICKDRADLRALFSLIAKSSSAGPRGLTSRDSSNALKVERDFTNAAKLKGYSYVSLYFGQQTFQHDLKSVVTEDAALVIYVYNVKKQLLENAIDVRNPAQIKRNQAGVATEIFWGSTWHMQTPLENLETGSYFIIEFHPDITHMSTPLSPSSAGKQAVACYATSAMYPINTNVIDSGMQLFNLSVSADHARQINPIMLTSERTSLFAELVINTRDRPIDYPGIFAQ